MISGFSHAGTKDMFTILIRIIISITFILLSYNSYSVDIVKLQVQQSSKKKNAHNIEVIRRALEITQPEYNAFELNIIKKTMSGMRMYQSSLEGKSTNAIIVPANARWDRQHIPIRVPVRLGLLNYRLLLVNKAALSKFENINTEEELKTLTIGLANYWETTKILKSRGFKAVETSYFEGLFSKLQNHHFDYLPRGIYEIYDELESRKAALQNVVIEPNIALNIPMLSYVYISPTEPRIAQRLKSGLEQLLESGELEKILYKHYANDIKRADLKNRKIIKIESDYYKRQVRYYSKDLLYSP